MSPLLVLSCAALTLSCPPPSAVEQGGQEHFHFLPPLVPQPEFAGTFDPSRDPIAEICALEASGCQPVIAEFTMESGPGSETIRVDTTAEHYIVNWHTKEFGLDNGQVYRIRVLLEGQEAGHAEVLVVASGQDLKNAETEEEIPLKDGRTLPIKFRIEEGLDMVGVVPAVTPDTLPGWVYDHETSDSPVLSGRFLTNILMVVFEKGGSQLDRQAAIDAINGRVVGGVRDHEDDGFYFVLVEDDHPDVPGKALVEAMEILDKLPQVALAAPEFLFDAEGLNRGGYVPPLPPDSVPEAVLNEIYDPANLIDGSPFITGKIPGNIIWIAFQHDAPQSQRQEAIDFIEGEVVGGLFMDPGGLYFVRISTDGTVEQLFEAIEELGAFDQVRFATPDLNLEWSPNHRGPVEAHGGQDLKNAETEEEIPLEDGRTLPIKFRIEEGLDMGDRVPAVPPDSLPSGPVADSISAPENQISDPRLGNSVPRDIVFVAFHAEATQQERQEAIDLIDGRVIGGLLDWYIVKIATDGTAESLVEAIEALKGLPQVRLAGPHPPEAIPAVATP